MQLSKCLTMLLNLLTILDYPSSINTTLPVWNKRIPKTNNP